MSDMGGDGGPRVSRRAWQAAGWGKRPRAWGRLVRVRVCVCVCVCVCATRLVGDSRQAMAMAGDGDGD